MAELQQQYFSISTARWLWNKEDSLHQGYLVMQQQQQQPAVSTSPWLPPIAGIG
jgi:hypothetical protein